MSEAFWNERYRSSSTIWSGQPNLTKATGIVPGTAFDAGCGEGAGAIWLAERGWRITDVDISTVALERGRPMPVRPARMWPSTIHDAVLGGQRSV